MPCASQHTATRGGSSGTSRVSAAISSYSAAASMPVHRRLKTAGVTTPDGPKADFGHTAARGGLHEVEPMPGSSGPLGSLPSHIRSDRSACSWSGTMPTQPRERHATEGRRIGHPAHHQQMLRIANIALRIAVAGAVDRTVSRSGEAMPGESVAGPFSPLLPRRFATPSASPGSAPAIPQRTLQPQAMQ